jgi:GNAT superfamily N-acetyltransferase
LVASRRAPEDARRTRLSLTGKGRRAFSSLNGKSQRSITRLIGPLSRRARRSVLDAMSSLEMNLSAGAAPATLFARFAAGHDEAVERCWIAESGNERLGCVFVVRNERDPGAAQLRCLLADPKGRGLGIGRRLVDECLTFAKSAGYAKMMLWTNDILISARRIYEAAGFRLVEESPHRSFGKDLIGQIWTRDL